MAENIDWQLKCGQIRQRGAHILDNELWVDCSFLLGPDNVPVKAHKLILAMASPVFEAMFYGPIAEGRCPITIPDIEPETFHKLLQYVYTDDIHLDDYLMAIELYYAAQKYMLPHLMTVCTTYLSCNLVPQKACRVYEFARLIGDEKLMVESLTMLMSETELALSDNSFEELTLETVVEIFSMDELNINSELVLLEAAERYVLAAQKRGLEEEEDNSEAFQTTLGEKIRPWLHDHPLNDSVLVVDTIYYDAIDEIISNRNSKDRIIENNNGKAVKDKENGKHYKKIQSCSKDTCIEKEASDNDTDNKGTKKVMKCGNSMRKLLKPIRFLTLTVEELAEYEPKTTLLTEHDMLAIIMNIASFGTYMPMPEGFSTCREYRYIE